MKKLLMTAVLLAVGIVGVTTPLPAAAARPGPTVELVGHGTYATDEWGRTGVHAEVTGRRFDGRFSGGLQITERQFPAPGACDW